MWELWLILAGVFLVLEIITVGFMVFWFAVGALLAMIVSFFTDNVVIQFLVFLVTSTLLLIFTKPIVNKILPKEIVKTQSSDIDGKVGIVTIDIEPLQGKGQVKIGNEKWSAKSADDVFIPTGTEVIVEKVDGVKAIVRKVNKN